MKGLTTRFTLVLSIALFLLSLAGCREERPELLPRGETGQVDENVVAMVGDEAITKEELEAPLMRLPGRKRAESRDKVLNSLISRKVFSNEARKVGLGKDPEIKEALQRATDETLAGYFIKKHVDPQAEPSEEEVKANYLGHKDQFVVPEGVLIQQIQVTTQDQAEAILKELQEGAAFNELAKRKSIARTWNKGGRLGWLYKGQMDPALEKAAFDLEEGKLSDVIQTKKGYEIIKVLDRKDKREIGFDEAKSRIRHKLSREKKRELIEKYYEDAGVDRNPAEEGVLVKVGDEVFTEEALALIMGKVSENRKENLTQRWIKYFIETKVFSKEARKVGLEKDPEVAKELQIRTDKVLAKAFRKKFIDEKFPVTDKAVAEYYETHLEEFTTPFKVRAKSILVKTKEEAEQVLKELEGGASFVLLAVEKSLHPKASTRAGEIGWFGKGEKDPAVEKAAFSLERGQISDIIKTEAGYQIIKVMSKKGGQTKPVEEVTEVIKMKLKGQRHSEEKQRYYEKAGVVISH